MPECTSSHPQPENTVHVAMLSGLFVLKLENV